MERNEYKEVFYHEYCKKCKYWEEKYDWETSVCEECLDEPINLYSHRPVRYEAKESLK